MFFSLLEGAGTVGFGNAFYFVAFFLFGSLFTTDIVTAQTIAYRQANLAANLPNVAKNVTQRLVNPFGIAFVSGEPFFIANNNAGRVTVHDVTGLSVRPGSFTVPNSAKTGFDTPTGIVADQNSGFGGTSLLKPFILVTNQRTVFTWSPGASGDLPQEATRVVGNSSTGAVYKGVAILIALGLFGFTTRTAGKFRTARFPLVTATGAAAIVALGLAIAGCGGIRQQCAGKPGHRFDHSDRPVWKYFSDDNHQSHCAIACRTWNSAND
jgi:hypothetical protein